MFHLLLNSLFPLLTINICLHSTFHSITHKHFVKLISFVFIHYERRTRRYEWNAWLTPVFKNKNVKKRLWAANTHKKKRRDRGDIHELYLFMTVNKKLIIFFRVYCKICVINVSVCRLLMKEKVSNKKNWHELIF